MKLEDIPYGNDFVLVIPCESDVEGCLTIQADSEGGGMIITATDEMGSAIAFVDKESQALMIIAAMQAFIENLKKTK